MSTRNYTKRGLNFKQVKQVQKIVNKNKRYKTYQRIITTEGNTTGDLREFTNNSIGNSQDQRENQTIFVHRIKFQMSIINDGVYNVYRVLVVRSKQGALALADMPAYSGAPDLDKMQVYYDRLVSSYAPNTQPPTILGMTHKFKTKKIPHLKVGYDTNTSATDAQENALYLFIVGNTAEASAANLVDILMEVNYYDALG